MKKLLTSALATWVAAAAFATMLATTGASAAPLSYQNLLLLNGWKTYSSDVRAAKVAIDANKIVHFLGAIRSPGENAHAFTLDVQFRPSKLIYLHTNLCEGRPGRIVIYPDGQAFVGSYGSFSDAQCFTSLEGLTFAKP